MLLALIPKLYISSGAALCSSSASAREMKPWRRGTAATKKESPTAATRASPARFSIENSSSL